ncbi:ubiquitin-like protein [Plakobranchus ocellatus]|uniref:Ubiquitin-like protein n=1 Tax=Plakobranchus ocellatus TaxID=259542 RepID=A0AAV4BP77_9GAST|nr:ubiquitin-like protein [Plakobranchus ocellatus]
MNGHKRLKLGECIHISGTKASFESGKSNVEVVVNSAGAAVTFYIYVGEVKLAASISSTSLKKAAANGIWICVVAKHRKAYMEVSWIPPVNGGFNVLAIIKLKGTEPNQELSPGESQPEVEKVAFGKPYQVSVKYFGGKSQEYNVTANTTTGDLKEMIQRNSQMPVAQQKLICNSKQLEDNKTLGYYGIKKNSELNVVSRLRGG